MWLSVSMSPHWPKFGDAKRRTPQLIVATGKNALAHASWREILSLLLKQSEILSDDSQ